MKRLLVFSLVCFLSLPAFAQNGDKPYPPLIPKNKAELLKNFYMSLNLRMAFRGYSLRGGTHDYQGFQFQNGYTALNISAKISDKISVHFRNRFNKSANIQTLDQLGGNIELANVKIQFTPDFSLTVGKQSAYFGGYEYSFSAMDILVYSAIQSNALAYVTGVGLMYDLSDKHSLGVQVLNSRTMHYNDKYGDVVAENIHEPNWPFEFVLKWEGSFFDDNFKTLYSYSYSREVKDMGTHFITLGHKYEHNNLTLMYDFEYSFEQVDTKGVATNIIQSGRLAQDVTYIGNWVRGEYDFSPKFTGLMTLMTNTAYGKRKTLAGFTEDKVKLRTSYGLIPTFYYRPFDNIDLRFFVAYIYRFYDYSNYAQMEFGATNYHRNEVRVGIISPLRIL